MVRTAANSRQEVTAALIAYRRARACTPLQKASIAS